jgi:hypothetical protein
LAVAHDESQLVQDGSIRCRQLDAPIARPRVHRVLTVRAEPVAGARLNPEIDCLNQTVAAVPAMVDGRIACRLESREEEQPAWIDWTARRFATPSANS